MHKMDTQIQKVRVGDTLCVEEWDGTLSLVAVAADDDEDITIAYDDGTCHIVKRGTVNLKVRQTGIIKSAEFEGVDGCKRLGDPLPKLVLHFENGVRHLLKEFYPDERWPQLAAYPGLTLREAVDM